MSELNFLGDTIDSKMTLIFYNYWAIARTNATRPDIKHFGCG